MGDESAPVVRLLVAIVLLVSLAGAGCGSEPPELTAEQARGLILQQFPQPVRQEVADPHGTYMLSHEATSWIRPLLRNRLSAGRVCRRLLPSENVGP